MGVKYELNGSSLNYSHDTAGDTFDISKASFGSKTELVDGVTKFEVTTVSGDNTNLPALVVLRLELVDKKTLKRIEANPSAKSNILKTATRREFRRLVVIDRGQPKPEL